MTESDFDNIDEQFYRQMSPKEDEDLHFGDDALDMSKRLDKDGNPVNPNQAPGLDPNDVPAECRTHFRRCDPKVNAEYNDDLIQPCQEESLVSHEESTDKVPEEVNEVQDESETEENTEGSSVEDNVDANDESDGPLFCPNCGQELFPIIVGEKTFYKHRETQENVCNTVFPGLDAVLTAIKQQEEIKNALKTAEEEEKQKQEEAAKEKEPPTKEASVEKGKISPEQSVVYMEFFSKQLSNIMQALGEIKSKEAQLDKILTEIAVLKTAVQMLSEEKEMAQLKNIVADLEERTNSMKDMQENMENSLHHMSNMEDDTKRMKEAERDLLLVTDNAGQQFYQFMNSVESLKKTDIQLNNMFPLLESYIKLLDSEYTAKLKTYSEKQVDLGNHFKKQSEKFLKETSKRMKFEAPTASSVGMSNMIVPTIIAFVLMLILKYVG